MTDKKKDPEQPCSETLDDLDDVTEADEEAADFDAEEASE